MAIIGPGAQQEIAQDVRPTLEGASEFEYITILNPLSDDFAIRVAQDVPVNMPFPIGQDKSGKVTQTTLTERDASMTYGLSLKNPDFQGRKHIINDTVIKAGQTINLKGNEAQVAIRQLVNEILQREGNKRLLADPTLRKTVEDRIIVSRGNVQDLMDNRLSSVQQQATEAVNRSNEVDDDEPFPGLNEPAGSTQTGSSDTGSESPSQERRGPGRPRKDQ